MHIHGGKIEAYSGNFAAGIGGGYGCDGGTVEIYGGNIIANGGETGFCDYASGIGCGWFDILGDDDYTPLWSYPVDGGTVTISGNVEVFDKEGKLVSFDSNMKYVKIVEKATDSLILRTNGKTFTVTPKGKDDGTGIVTVTLCDRENKNRLLDVKIFDLSKVETVTGTFEKSGYVKAFWWTDFEKIIPVCAPKGEAITE